MKINVIAPALTAITLFAVPALAAGSATSVSIGYYRSSGDYGLDSNTDTDLTPLTITHERGKWSEGLTVPWLKISGFGTVVMTGRGPARISMTPGQGIYSFLGSGRYTMGSGMTTTTTTTTRVSESGLGDISAFLAYSFLPLSAGDTDGLTATVSATVKFATGDEKKGLGTGGTDYGLELGLSKPIGSLTPFLTAGYTVTGDNGQISYNDYPYLSTGVDYAFNHDLSAGLSWDYSASLSDDTEDCREASANLRWQMDKTWSATVSTSIGMTDSSPDTTWGVELTAGF